MILWVPFNLDILRFYKGPMKKAGMVSRGAQHEGERQWAHVTAVVVARLV